MKTLEELGLRDRSFCLYGNGFSGIKVSELMAMDDVQAEAATSGCEGVYVEVARWNESRKRYERFAFEKFLGGEVPGIDDPAVIAAKFTFAINGRARVSRGFVNCMPNYGHEDELESLREENASLRNRLKDLTS